MNDLAERVRAERRIRGWSIRAAGTAGGISNTTWGSFERNGEVTDAVHRGVMQAFGWPATWQESPPEMPVAPVGETAALRAELADVRDQLRDLAEVMAELIGELRRERDAADGSPARRSPQRRPASG